MSRININDLLANPTTLAQVCDNVANGGSLLDLCNTWQVRYCDVMRWINDDADRKKQYAQSILDRGEWFIQRVLKEISDLAFRNVKSIYNDDHTLKPVKDWPSEVVASLDEIEVVELFDQFGKTIGHSKKAKFAQKLKALELLGKNNYMFVEHKKVMVGDANDKEFCNSFFGINKQQGSPTTGATKIL